MTNETYEIFCKKIGYRFKNINLFNQAIIHSSFTKNKLSNNERLEFLGDRVLGLAVSKLLYLNFQNEDEGALAVRFANLVCSKTLSEVAEFLHLESLIKISLQEQKRPQKLSKNVLADSCEAIFGAIFLDSDFDTIFNIIEKIWKQKIQNNTYATKDYKTMLQEYAQSIGENCPTYKLVSKTGADHEPTFTMETIVKKIKCSGTGTSKKEAEQNTAFNVLKELKIVK